MAIVTERDLSVELPQRYKTPWRDPFERAIRDRLVAGTTVLDIGSGRNPSLPPVLRPPGVTWIGLDVARSELQAARPGDYDEIVAADVAIPFPALSGRVDLAVSWQVFEHVRPLADAIDNIHTALRAGGELVTVFSGAWSAFALVNRMLPDRVGAALVGRTMRRRGSDRPVFPAHYDQCHARALRHVFQRWSHVEIVPLYRGATYFHFSPLLQRAYLAYENRIAARRVGDLATHYFVVARR